MHDEDRNAAQNQIRKERNKRRRGGEHIDKPIEPTWSTPHDEMPTLPIAQFGSCPAGYELRDLKGAKPVWPIDYPGQIKCYPTHGLD